MNVSVQSSSLAMIAAIVPPAPSENSTWPVPWRSPNADPSRITVLPTLPEGLVALFTKSSVGATAVNAPASWTSVPSAFRTVTASAVLGEIPAGT